MATQTRTFRNQEEGLHVSTDGDGRWFSRMYRGHGGYTRWMSSPEPTKDMGASILWGEITLTEADISVRLPPALL